MIIKVITTITTKIIIKLDNQTEIKMGNPILSRNRYGMLTVTAKRHSLGYRFRTLLKGHDL